MGVIPARAAVLFPLKEGRLLREQPGTLGPLIKVTCNIMVHYVIFCNSPSFQPSLRPAETNNETWGHQVAEALSRTTRARHGHYVSNIVTPGAIQGVGAVALLPVAGFVLVPICHRPEGTPRGEGLP
eukprot:368004-Prorocentrum_minimum.AAC.1